MTFEALHSCFAFYCGYIESVELLLLVCHQFPLRVAMRRIDNTIVMVMTMDNVNDNCNCHDIDNDKVDINDNNDNDGSSN